MIRAISLLTDFVYSNMAKPLLFRAKPDAVHNSATKLGSRVQKVSFLRWLIRTSWAYQNTDNLQQTIDGVEFKNPVGLSAGFDKNIELVPLMKSIGFGFMVGGSVTSVECAGNPRPWFYRLPKTKSLVVNAGLANQGIGKIAERVKAYSRDIVVDFPLSISAAKTNSPETVTDSAAVQDYLATLKTAGDENLSPLVEINISCPNTYGGEPFTTPDRLELLLSAVDKLNLRQSIYIKMPQDLDWEHFKELLDIILNHKITGVTLTNLSKARHEIELKDELPDDVKGNLSGKPTQEKSNYLIKKTYQYCGDKLVIIGVGGIFTAEDAYEKIRLGATLVALVTGLIFEGPQVVGKINLGLVELLKRDGFTHISQAIGVDSRNDINS